MTWLFDPSPYQHNVFAYWDGGLSEDDIKQIIAIGSSYHEEAGQIGKQDGKGVDDNYRDAEVSWIPLDADTWLNDKMMWIARQLNGLKYQYDLWGFAEKFQFTTYYPNNQHYEWHQDTTDADPPRKMSMVVMLSDPSEYEGGELQIMTQKDPTILEPVKGRVYMFPSHTVHRVTPVTSGIRRSLVIWITGPKLR